MAKSGSKRVPSKKGKPKGKPQPATEGGGGQTGGGGGSYP